MDRQNPIVLFIHGGPGSPMSPYSDNIFQKWFKNFTIVNWDQRGSGRSYKKNSPQQLTKDFLILNHLTLNQMVKDGIELTEFLTQYLNQKKVILIGDSWGTVLATKMAANRPDLFRCYIGTSQIVNLQQSLSFGFNRVRQLTEQRQDSVTLEKLESLGKPPYPNGQTAGKLFRIIKKYERELSAPIPKNFYQISESYKNDNDQKARAEGDDYSFFSLIGDQKLRIKGMCENIDLTTIGQNLKIPIHLYQGENDILCPKEINKPYYNTIKLKTKSFDLIENTGHGITPEILDKQYRLIMENYSE
ncbi:alpha/beta hydrolase [Flavivirga algicola]|uniref:Proline iminopeptidase n=1 Tax=Flavivirga algicola TaxID=2729136 RepID=A0ABX1S624_9FLAO|nr:alpha/beta hydrolase [Flavivirga algicola]NMH89965.1 alpha/beta hydrolase [Flavivirga algicola]